VAVPVLAPPFQTVPFGIGSVRGDGGQVFLNMPHPSKKQRMTGDGARFATVGDLSVDVLADIFGYLDDIQDIMQKRRVCKKWKEAVKMTIVPPTNFLVDSAEKYNAK
jgi:hypothetical protein